ncbi:MAG: vitamin K epoxide reductase family protein [Candidatus Saccharibacteria bacterium]
MIKLFQKHDKTKLLYATVTLAGIVGFVASFLQMVEKVALLKSPGSPLICDINPIFSCSNVLNVWQSSVFGFPNALMCITFFAIMMTAGVIGWTGGTMHKNLRLVLQAMTLFFVGFGFWYLWQGIFNIGSLCIFCLFCYAAVLSISFAWLRINHKDLPINKSARKFIDKLITDNSDTFIWLTIALVIIAEMVIQFV